MQDLRQLGYERTEQESPFHEDGTLWTNSYELVCDQTAQVIRKGTEADNNPGYERDEERHEYQNTKTVKLYGGYTSSYEWGKDEGTFVYDRSSSK